MNIGLPGILVIIFVVAKLAGVITWSWWWVFAPLLVGMALGWLILIGIAVIGVWISRGR